MIKCHNCGAQVADGSRFCSECGKEITQANVCPYCGASVGEGDAFCQNCGKNLSEPIAADNVEKTVENREEEESPIKKYLPYILGVIALIAICGGGWYYWNKTQKDNALLTMETVIDLYKSNSKEHITQVLKENGYSLFKSEEESEYWTKNVQLKEVQTYNGDTVYEATEKKGGSVSIYGTDYITLSVSVYSDEDFKEWEKQLLKLGYKEEKYGEDLPEEDGWTALGAHGNLCKLYQDSKGNSVEFMKDGDGHPGYDVYSVSESE